MSRSLRLADIWPSQVRLVQPGPPEYRDGAVEDRRERGGRGAGVVLGEPQRGHCNRHLPAFAVLFAEFRQGLLGALGLGEAHQGMQQQRPPGMRSTYRADHLVACEYGLAPQYRYSMDLSVGCLALLPFGFSGRGYPECLRRCSVVSCGRSRV